MDHVATSGCPVAPELRWELLPGSLLGRPRSHSMQDVLYIALTAAIFAVLAAVVAGLEQL
jgi:hypothetical protein